MLFREVKFEISKFSVEVAIKNKADFPSKMLFETCKFQIIMLLKSGNLIKYPVLDNMLQQSNHSFIISNV